MAREGKAGLMHDDLLLKCRRAFEEKSWDVVADLGRRALMEPDIEPFELVNVGIVVRDSKKFELADTIFKKLIEEDRNFRYAYYELAFSYMLQNRHSDSALLLRDYIVSWPEDYRVLALYIKSLCLLGALSEVDQILQQSTAPHEWLETFSHLRAFGRFISEFPVSKMRYLIQSVSQRSSMLTSKQVETAILTAKAKKAPFSLLRLGDGEGTCIRLDLEDEIKFEPLYSDNRDQFKKYWFGKSISGFEDRFETAVSGLALAVKEADIVGVPLPGWLEHEYAIGSTRGISSLVNVYRLLNNMQQAGFDLKQCAQSVHIDLGRSKLFEELIGGESDIGLISCFSDLPKAIEHGFNVKHVDFYKLPGEQHFKEMLGDEATDGRHFPDVFSSTMERLDQNHSGKIFLVAGGILGKFYVQKIKQRGGIAVDIGSLADVWVKKATRPGYEGLVNLALA